MTFAAKRVILVFFLLLCTRKILYASPGCTLVAGSRKGCVPTPDTLSVSFSGLAAGVKASSFTWTFGDNSNSSQASIKVVHIYYKRGQYQPSVTVKFSDGTTCTATLSYKINIYDNPVPGFSRPTDTIRQCDTSTKYCFKNTSRPGLDKAPVNKFLWDFRDGSPFDSSKNPCHSFPYSYTFKMTLEAIDTNGCSNLFSQNVSVRILPASITPKPDFVDSFDIICSTGAAVGKFKNTTDTVGKSINWFKWDFGDGTVDSCNLVKSSCKIKWNAFMHTYTKPGTYCPILWVDTKYKCGYDSFKYQKCIDVIQYTPNPTELDTHECFSNDIVRFRVDADPRPQSGNVWDFGDGNDSVNNVATNSPSATHTYIMPGIYTVYFASTYKNCFRDTVFCKKVKIFGPKAKIMLDTSLDRIPWDTLKYIPPSNYAAFFDTCHPPVMYTLRDSVFIPNGDTIFGSYCNAKLAYAYGTNTVYNCKKEVKFDSFLVYNRPIVKTKDTSIISYNVLVWNLGDPYPVKGKVFKGVHFENRPLVWDDTDIFSPHCGPPKLIHFTNFSWKYRGYDAGDNFPPGSNDTCRKDFNPSYPYASDSLTYFWDFSEGNFDTSTTAHPDKRSRFSTEKLPWHLFLDTGCFDVTLTVRDPVTQCSDSTDIKIVLQEPSAKWDAAYDTVKKMDYNEQVAIGNTFQFKRRGFLLFGKPCDNTFQYIDMSETLPSCLKNQYGLVLDSLHDTYLDSCGAPAKKPSIYHEWSINQNGYFKYADSGWKSIGVAITNNPFCRDTFWYHDYKYIFKLSADLIPIKGASCPGGTIGFTPKYPDQKGVSIFSMRYVYYPDRKNYSEIGRDTFRHVYFKNNLGDSDTATTSLNDPLFPIVDSAKFNFLNDTIHKAFGDPGHYFIYTFISNRFGCEETNILSVVLGHYADFKTTNQTVCVGEPVTFYPTIMYNQVSSVDSFVKGQDGYDRKTYWKDPSGTRGGRKPKYPEKFKWDFDGDGIIDDSTHYQPSFSYKKVGNYTVRLYTKDSLNCDWQMLEKKVYIKSIKVDAGFTIAPPGPDRFCNPQLFYFKSNSVINDSLLPGQKPAKIVLYVWDFGDGNPPIRTTNDSIGYILTHNGTYAVNLTVYTDTSTGANHKGCSDQFSMNVNLDGPLPSFKIVGDTAGCVPFTLKVIDLSKKTTFKDWRLGDGTIVSTTTQDTVYLTYTKVGIYCPRLVGASQVTDSNHVTHYCSDTFPFKNCQFQVNVLPRPKVNAVFDTIVCVNQYFTFDDKSDTSFKNWTLDFGDSTFKNFSAAPHTGHLYTHVGVYTLRYKGTGPFCPDSLTKKIKVVNVKAGFHMDSSRQDTPVFYFINTSLNASHYTWIFDDGTVIETPDNSDISHSFNRTGIINVCLVARNNTGCEDSVCHALNLDKYIFIPNVFTPGNNDGKNDRYYIVARGNQLYGLEIFNRWGQKVFSSDDKSYTWDGTKMNDGHTLCAAGTYYFIFHYQLIGEKEKTVEGTVTLIR